MRSLKISREFSTVFYTLLICCRFGIRRVAYAWIVEIILEMSIDMEPFDSSRKFFPRENCFDTYLESNDNEKREAYGNGSKANYPASMIHAQLNYYWLASLHKYSQIRVYHNVWMLRMFGSNQSRNYDCK
jgi:hypothetical protein